MGRRKVEDDPPEDILPSQWHPEHISYGAERLCWAQLYDAMNILLGKLPKDKTERGRVLRQRAIDLAWLHSDDCSYAYSFVSLCDLFGLSVSGTRAYVRKAMQDQACLPRKYWHSTSFAPREQ